MLIGLLKRSSGSVNNVLRALAWGIHDDIEAMGINCEIYGPSLVDHSQKPFIIHWKWQGIVTKIILNEASSEYWVAGNHIRTYEYCDPAFPDQNLYELIRARASIQAGSN